MLLSTAEEKWIFRPFTISWCFKVIRVWPFLFHFYLPQTVVQKTVSSNHVLEQQSTQVFISSSNVPQWRHAFLLTVLTVPPCEPVTFIVCLLLWDELNPQSHWLILSRWRMAFSAASSDIIGLLCCGHSHSERMNHINKSHLCIAQQRSWGRLVAFEHTKPGNTGSFKQNSWYWYDLFMHYSAHLEMHCSKVYLLFSYYCFVFVRTF